MAAAVFLGASLMLAGCGTTAANPSTSGGNSSSTASQQKVQVVHVVASDWKWTLDKTTFSANEPIQFDVTSKQGTHGFSIEGTSVSKPVSPGQNVQVTWTPPKPGTYTIRCDIYCGKGHAQMVQSFTVS